MVKFLIEEPPYSNQTMNFHDQLRSIEERFDIDESEHARELGRAVAHLQD